MKFRTFVEMDSEFYYHGSPKAFEKFDYKYLGTGKGWDQEGPGFYFTNSDKDVAHYGSNVYKVKLKLRKVVPLKGRTKRKEVETMLRAAPDLADTLTNWDENPVRAFRMAVEAIMRDENPHQAFQTVWYDFYRNDSAQYLKNMVDLLGYDGVVVPRTEGVIHVIVFSPDAIDRIS